MIKQKHRKNDKEYCRDWGEKLAEERPTLSFFHTAIVAITGTFLFVYCLASENRRILQRLLGFGPWQTTAAVFLNALKNA